MFFGPNIRTDVWLDPYNFLELSTRNFLDTMECEQSLYVFLNLEIGDDKMVNIVTQEKERDRDINPNFDGQETSNKWRSYNGGEQSSSELCYFGICSSVGARSFVFFMGS